MRVRFSLCCVAAISLLIATVEADEEYYGVSVGKLVQSEYGISGEVYLANSSVIYIRNFAIRHQIDEDDINFVLSSAQDISPIRQIYKESRQKASGEPVLVPVKWNFNYDIDGAHLFAFAPNGANLNAFTHFGIFSVKSWKYLASVQLDKAPPVPYCCITNPKDPTVGIIGHHYDAGSGPIEVLDTRTVVFKAFSLDGTAAPDGWILAGNGSAPITRKSGRKAMVVGTDTPMKQCSIKDNHRGDSELKARLLGRQTVYNIKFLAIFCYQYDVDFGHIRVDLSPARHAVPLYIPPVRSPHSDEKPVKHTC